MSVFNLFLRPQAERLFWGLRLPERFKDHLSEVQHQLREGLSDLPIRWSNRSDFHVTIKFLGATRGRRQAIAASKAALRAQTPPSVRLARLGVFHGRSTTLWAGFDAPSNDRLQRFRSAVEREHVNAGFRSEARFNPHVTLGRIPRGAEGDLDAVLETIEVPQAEFTAEHLTLFKTVGGRGDAQFRVVKELPIG